MPTLKERLEEVMRAMNWQHADLVRVSRQSQSAVSQWLGHSNKPIKTIGKLEAALHLERETGYSALWLAKGIGPKHVHPTAPATRASEPTASYSTPADTLHALHQLLRQVPPDMRTAFADVLRGWAADGGTDDRSGALLALLAASGKQRALAA